MIDKKILPSLLLFTLFINKSVSAVLDEEVITQAGKEYVNHPKVSLKEGEIVATKNKFWHPVISACSKGLMPLVKKTVNKKMFFIAAVL
jgi:hypothetical protein